MYFQCKQRRSNESSAVNTSISSSDSANEIVDEMFGAKRTRCETKLIKDAGAVQAVVHQDTMMNEITFVVGDIKFYLSIIHDFCDKFS